MSAVLFINGVVPEDALGDVPCIVLILSSTEANMPLTLHPLWRVLPSFAAGKRVRHPEWEKDTVCQGRREDESSTALCLIRAGNTTPGLLAPPSTAFTRSSVYRSLRVHTAHTPHSHRAHTFCLCLRRVATVQIFIMLSRLSHEVFF